jgi:hypothetical protein
MNNSTGPGVLLGDGMSRLALAICILAALLVVVPLGLASIGFGALLGVAGGLETPTVGTTGSRPIAGAPGVATLLPPLAQATPDATRPDVTKLLAQARTWIGTRYVFGGCSSVGIDCSCFIQTVFRSMGVDLPRTSQLQYNATVGRGSAVGNPEPGDVVFFFHTYSDPGQDWTHVGVVSRVDSNGVVWMIDAPGARAAGDPPDAPYGRVREEPIAGSWLQHRPTYARLWN